MKQLSYFFAGLLFAAGLALSGMTDRDVVLNFLDVRGNFDPSLLFVMGAAVVVFAVVYRLSFRKKSGVIDSSFPRAGAHSINARLVAGAALFGVGWGLSGACPGPAWMSLATFQTDTLLFVLSMFGSMTALRVYEKRKALKSVFPQSLEFKTSTANPAE